MPDREKQKAPERQQVAYRWNWVNWARRQTVGSPAGKSVLLEIALFANQKGECWPGVDTIRSNTELGESTVRKHISNLQSLGLISVTERPGASNFYRLTPPDGRPLYVVDPPSNGPSPSTSGTPPLHDVDLSPPDGGPKQPITTIEQPNEPCAADAPHTFDFNSFLGKFESAYPRMGDERSTEDELRKAIDAGADPDHILAAVRAYAEEQKGNNPQYIAYSENWVRNKRWERHTMPKSPAANAAAVDEQRAKAIREGQGWISRHISAAAARDLVARGLVTPAECASAGVQL